MKKVSLIFIAAVMTTIMMTSYGCSSKKVNIGKQVWMVKNLNVDKFRNGDPIPNAKTDEEWRKAGDEGKPAWCYYENDPNNGAKYGKLYNWYAVNDPRGLAPKGWHVPSDEEWTELTDTLGGPEFIIFIGYSMKSTSGWSINEFSTNSSGFSGLPGGYRNNNGDFTAIGEHGHWWSSTEYPTDYAYFRTLICFTGSVGRMGSSKKFGFSVRCLSD